MEKDPEAAEKNAYLQQIHRIFCSLLNSSDPWTALTLKCVDFFFSISRRKILLRAHTQAMW